MGDSGTRIEQHGWYSIWKDRQVSKETVAFAIVHRRHGDVGGAPDLQEARNLITDMGGRLRPQPAKEERS